MEDSLDIRWVQRFENYKKALDNLNEAVSLAESRELTKLEKQGLIQCFEFTYELAWNSVKDYYVDQGETNIQGSRDAFRIAYNRGLISNGEIMMAIIKSRQLTSHSYNEKTADEIYRDIINVYCSAFNELKSRLDEEKERMR